MTEQKFNKAPGGDSRNATGMSGLLELSSQFFNRHVLPVGAAVLLAVGESQKADAAPALPKNNTTTPPTSGLSALTAPKQETISAHYNVQKGDTLSGIATRFSISEREIVRVNPGLNPNKLDINQTILLPGVRSGFHVIKKGESLATIAEKRGIPLKDLLKANPGVDPRKLKPGTLLQVPAEKNKATSSPNAVPLPQRALNPQQGPKSALTSQSDNNRPSTTMTTQQADNTLVVAAVESPCFWASMLKVFDREGGKSTKSKDRAHQGEVKMTNLGVTPMAMKDHLKKEGVAQPTPDMIRERLSKLTTETAIPIYAAGYWNADYQRLGQKLSFLVFDWGVNSGPSTAIMQLQKTLGLKQDGVIGKETLREIEKYPEHQICALYMTRRKEFYLSLVEKDPEQQEFLNGWLNRCDSVHAYVMSEPFKRLNDLFERTPVTERSFAVPLLHGEKILGRGVREPTLTRWLQENLVKVGWQVSRIDGLFGPEMDQITRSFQEHYKIETTPETSGRWGARETRALLALRASPTLASN
jgi:lysozyme family protein/LysM repeat protein